MYKCCWVWDQDYFLMVRTAAVGLPDKAAAPNLTRNKQKIMDGYLVVEYLKKYIQLLLRVRRSTSQWLSIYKMFWHHCFEVTVFEIIFIYHRKTQFVVWNMQFLYHMTHPGPLSKNVQCDTKSHIKPSFLNYLFSFNCMIKSESGQNTKERKWGVNFCTHLKFMKPFRTLEPSNFIWIFKNWTFLKTLKNILNLENFEL